MKDLEVHAASKSTLSGEELAQFRCLVRYIKRWRDVKYQNDGERKKVYSIGLTIMIKKCFHPSIAGDDTRNDLLSLRDTILEILESSEFFRRVDDEKYDLVVNLPVAPECDVFRKHGKTVGTRLRANLQTLLRKLEEVITEESLKKQCEILRSQFGDDFPVPDEDPKKEKAAEKKERYRGARGIVASNQGA
jgi:hypothetical protein